MRLLVNDHYQDFIDIREFRKTQGLPDQFSTAHFEPKDYTGLGRIDKAGKQLQDVRERVLACIPSRLTLSALMEFIPKLNDTLEKSLYAVNSSISLQDVEIEFAVAGFADVNQTILFSLITAERSQSQPPTFWQIYQQWLDTTTRISQAIHHYDHQGQQWQIKLVNTCYGRAGLIIHSSDGSTHYIQDANLSCPAEGFMIKLMNEVFNQILHSLGANN